MLGGLAVIYYGLRYIAANYTPAGGNLLVCELAVLVVVIRLHIEAIAQALIEIPSYLWDDSDIFRLVEIEDDVMHTRGSLAEGSVLLSSTRLGCGEDAELCAEAIGQDTLNLEIQIPKEVTKGVRLDDGLTIDQRVKLCGVRLGGLLCQYRKSSEERHEKKESLEHKL